MSRSRDKQYACPVDSTSSGSAGGGRSALRAWLGPTATTPATAARKNSVEFMAENSLVRVRTATGRH
jgi:hypothetical protein